MADAADSKSADRKVVKVGLLSPTESLIKNTGNSKESSFYWGFSDSFCLQLCQPLPTIDTFQALSATTGNNREAGHSSQL